MIHRRAETCLVLLIVAATLAILTPLLSSASEAYSKEQGSQTSEPSISVPEGMEKAVAKEMTQVSTHFKKGARKLFERTRLGCDLGTIESLQQWIMSIPLKIPSLVQNVMEQGRVLGLAGSLVMMAFLVAILYSLIGQKRVLSRVEEAMGPVRKRMTETSYPYVLSLLKVVVASLIPLLLLGLFWLINAFIEYEASWFLLTGRLLGLWTVGALLLNVLHETLTKDLFHIPSHYGWSIYRVSRFVLFYILGSIAIFWTATAFEVPEDVLALLRFVISLSIVLALILLLLKKRALLSLLPTLPYRSYQVFAKGLARCYFPAIFLTFVSGLLWCAGYHRFCKVLWIKTWAVAGTFIAIMVVYHVLRRWLEKWANKKGIMSEEAQILFRALKSLLLYATVTVTIVLVFDLLGIRDPISSVLSFPILKVGKTPLSLWIVIKAALLLLAFVYVARLLRAYLDYAIYPSIGVDAGLAYAMNTFLNYFLLIIGLMFSLRAVGLDLRMFMVFAGALGVGVGFGLQHMVADIASGFSIIFGRMIRKGDWIRVGETLGMVQEIGLRATLIRTSDHVEYLLPNSQFVSSTIVNYTLSTPLVRVHIPVGVSYDSEPEEVTKILLQEAAANPRVEKTSRPEVWFDSYGDSSLNFVLLVWIDVRVTGEKGVRSELYYSIFNALRKAGIEIPFPQREIHIRSAPPQIDPAKA